MAPWAFGICHAEDCPHSNGDQDSQLLALLDYMAINAGRQLVSVAECAYNIYQSADLTSFHAAYPKRTGRLLRDVTDVQRRASEKLEARGDTKGRDRFHRMEVALRKKVLQDLGGLPADVQVALTLERVPQITYLIQILDKSGDAKAINEFLTAEDYEYFQPQVIDAWLRSLYSCPAWKLAGVGNLTDAQLRDGVCQQACTGSARAALGNIENWRTQRTRDWEKSGSVKELHRRLNNAIQSCGSQP